MASGTEKAQECLRKIKGNELYTSILNLYEIFYSLKREREEDQVIGYIETIKSMCNIALVDERVAFLAADIHTDEKLPAIDSFVYATAILLGGKVLTGDPHFKGKERVVFIG